MTPRSREYLELLNEKERQRVTNGLSHAQEIEFASKLDKIWNQLDECEQETIASELVRADQGIT